MKVTIQIYTERGPFRGKVMEVPDDEAEDLKDAIMLAITGGNYFKFETDNGYVMLGKELLRSAVFEVKQESGW